MLTALCIHASVVGCALTAANQSVIYDTGNGGGVEQKRCRRPRPQLAVYLFLGFYRAEHHKQSDTSILQALATPDAVRLFNGGCFANDRGPTG